MADIDTSEYPKLKNTSPLETITGFANLQNVMNQNKLFQQQFQTNQAVSNIYKQAIKPDGTIDQDKLTNLLATDPNASYGLPEAYRGSQEATQRNVNIDISKVQQAQAHLQAISGYFAPLIKPGATSRDVAGALAHANANGLADTQHMANIWASLPRDPRTGQIDESQIPAWAQQQQLQVMSAQERLNAMSPQPTLVNTGQAQVPMRFPQVGAPTQAGPGIQNELPPTTQRYNPATHQMEFVGAGGGAGGGGPAPQMAGGGPGGAPGGGGMAAAPPLGAPEAASVDASFGAKQGTELQSMADNVPARKALLGNLEGALGQFTSGPGQNWKMVAKAFANASNPFGNIFDAKSIASQEEFNKQAVQLAQQQFQALGGTGTNSQLDSAMHTSPNDALSKLGNKGIIAMLKGNEDAISAKNQAWQSFKQQNGPQSYGQFSVQFNKSYDPRVFQSQYLTPDDRKKMLSGMTKPEQKGFLNSYRTALSNGWVQLPGQ